MEDLEEKKDYKDRVKYVCKAKNTCTLNIKNLRISDSGEYKFRILTKKQKKYSGSPALHVKMSRTTVTEGQKVTLNCSSSCPGDTNPTYIWYHNSLLLDSQKMAKKNKLTLRSATSDNSGSYSCAIKGHEDHPSPAKALTVRCEYAPRNTSASVNPSSNTAEGDTVTLTCSSDANPPVHSYTWYWTSGNVTILRGRGEHLTLTQASGDGGCYHCEALSKLSPQNSSCIEVILAARPTQHTYSIAVAVTVFVVLILVFGIIYLSTLLTILKQGDSGPTTSYLKQRVESGDEDDVQYASVQFKARNKDKAPDSTATQPHVQEKEEDVTYASVNILNASQNRR
ncbi:hypothetical protein ACEWY4_017749 [Coilia grayii]|uniref:B-cell receptor CD22 n=1 Tax=Coilia grayii TaxID=363190 RepID=A0ABD1JHP1_9TELE